MYNENQKRQFIDYFKEKYPFSKGIEVELPTLFNRTGKIEADFQKDMADFDYETTKLFLSSFLTGTPVYQKRMFSVCKYYVDWCIMNGKTSNTSNNFDTINEQDIDISNSYRLRMLKDENMLAEYLEIGFRSLSDNTADNLYRAILIFIFCGIPTKDIYKIQKKDVDLENGTIWYCGDKKIVPSVLLPMLTFYSKQTGYNKPTNSIVKYGFLKKHDTPAFLAFGATSTKPGSRYIYNIVTDLNKNLKSELKKNIHITMKNIFLSGIFCRIYQKEKTIGEADFDELTVQFSTKVGKYYQKQYDIWKESFNLY